MASTACHLRLKRTVCLAGRHILCQLIGHHAALQPGSVPACIGAPCRPPPGQLPLCPGWPWAVLPPSAPDQATSQQQQRSGISFCHTGFECQTVAHDQDECTESLEEFVGTVVQIIWQADLRGIVKMPLDCLNVYHKASHP